MLMGAGASILTCLQCCLIINCEVPQGAGYCKNLSQGCADGEFVEGSPVSSDSRDICLVHNSIGLFVYECCRKVNIDVIHQPDWPCPGDDNVQCCVKYEDMSNSTTSSTATSASTKTSSPTVTSSTAQSNTSTSPPAQAPPPPSGLTGAQVGGIVGGVAGAALLLALAGFLFFLKRKHARASAEGGPTAGDDAKPPGTSSTPVETAKTIDGSQINGMEADTGQGSPSLERHELANVERHELPNVERHELPNVGRYELPAPERHELPSPGGVPPVGVPGSMDRSRCPIT